MATPLQYSRLEYSTDRGAWRASVHGVTKSRTRLTLRIFHRCGGHINAEPSCPAPSLTSPRLSSLPARRSAPPVRDLRDSTHFRDARGRPLPPARNLLRTRIRRGCLFPAHRAGPGGLQQVPDLTGALPAGASRVTPSPTAHPSVCPGGVRGVLPGGGPWART